MSFQISTNFNVPQNPAMFVVNPQVPQLVNVPQYSFVQMPQYTPFMGCSGMNTFSQQSVPLDSVSFSNLFGFMPEGTWIETSSNVRMTYENNVFHCNGSLKSTFMFESGNVTMTLEGTKYMVAPRLENGVAILEMRSSRSLLCFIKEPQVNLIHPQQMLFPQPMNSAQTQFQSRPTQVQPSPTYFQPSPAYFHPSPTHSEGSSVPYSSCSSDEFSATEPPSPTYDAMDADSMDCSDSMSTFSLDDTASERSSSTFSDASSAMEIERERGETAISYSNFEALFRQQTDKSMNKQDLISAEIPKVMHLLLRQCPVNDLRTDISSAERQAVFNELNRKLGSGNAQLKKEAQDEIQRISSWHDTELVMQDGAPVQEFTMKGDQRELKYTKDGAPVYMKNVITSNALREESRDLEQAQYAGNRTVLHFRAKNKKGVAALVPFLTYIIHECGIQPECFTALPAFNSCNSKNKKNTYKGLLVYVKFSKSDMRKIAKIQKECYFAGERWCDLVQGLVQQNPAETSKKKGYKPLVEAFYGC